MLRCECDQGSRCNDCPCLQGVPFDLKILVRALLKVWPVLTSAFSLPPLSDSGHVGCHYGNHMIPQRVSIHKHLVDIGAAVSKQCF